MKHIYKHGNQFWYQRAVPEKFHSILGVKNLKVSLKTNKLFVAIKRSKLQALEHKKLFNNLKNKSENFFLKFMIDKKIDIKRFQIKFNDDFEDFVSNEFLNYDGSINNFNESLNLNKKDSIENQLFDRQQLCPNLSTYFDYFFLKEYKFKPNQLFKFKTSLKFFLDNCPDKIIDSYTENDLKLFINSLQHIELANKKKIEYCMCEIFSFACKKYNIKSNPFKRLKSQINKNKESEKIISYHELLQIKNYCLSNESLYTFLLAAMINTGCNIKELIGLCFNDVYFDNFQSFLIIRSNSKRQIKNLYKIRSIPLTGLSLWGMKKIFSKVNIDKINQDKNFYKLVEKKIKNILFEYTESKSVSLITKTFISRLIKIECPEEILLELLGRSKKHRIYNRQISLDIKKSWLEQLEI